MLRDIISAQELLDEIRRVDTHVRINGNRWTDFLDDLAEKYDLEPDMRPRLYVSVRSKQHED